MELELATITDILEELDRRTKPGKVLIYANGTVYISPELTGKELDQVSERIEQIADHENSKNITVEKSSLQLPCSLWPAINKFLRRNQVTDGAGKAYVCWPDADSMNINYTQQP